MVKYRKWFLSLGLMAATPGITLGGLPTLSGGDKAPAEQSGTEQSGAAEKQANQKTAEGIAAALRKAGLAGYDINISFRQGVATLSGKISDEKQKSRVTQVVASVNGVQGVDNRLETTTPSRGGSGLQQADYRSQPGQGRNIQLTAQQVEAQTANQQTANSVAKALSAAKFTGYDIEVRVQQGTAILGGEVDSAEARERASHVAGQVPGVAAVHNQLRVKGEPAPNPQMMAMQAGYPQQYGPIQPAMYQGGDPSSMMGPPPGYGMPAGNASHQMYNNPHLPEHAWPSYASYPNSAQVSYPKEYSASAWPYIGPFYPYPQVPLGWRKAQLEWDDGHWNLSFNSRTDRWWWFVNPKNW
ncbi:MAG: BON domain-containing protein [Planctomycetota bacterium]|nr:BON domain-containing protein [Planctomycetota bacterium]